MDGQLYISKNGSVYALLPAAESGPGDRTRAQGLPALATESDVAQALLSQLLQRQQHGLALRQAPFQLDLGAAEPPSLAQPRGSLPDEALNIDLLHGSVLQSLQHVNPLLVPNNVGPSHSSQPGPSHVSRRRVSVESPSNSDSQSPPPSTRGERSERNGLGTSASVSAKEKNRQAQRRFRERQKDLIANLKLKVETLTAKVQENEKEIIALKEENAMLRGRMEGKQMGASVTLPAEALQSLLQMSGAGSLLAEAAAAAAAAGDGVQSGGGLGPLGLGLGPRRGHGAGAGPGVELGLRGRIGGGGSGYEQVRQVRGIRGFGRGMAGLGGGDEDDGLRE